MKYLVQVIVAHGIGSVEIEAETIEEAKEKFHKGTAEIKIFPLPPNKNVLIEIHPLTDVNLDITPKLLLPGKEESNV